VDGAGHRDLGRCLRRGGGTRFRQPAVPHAHPLDATAASAEAESRIFALYQEPDYANRMGFTLSTLVDFAPPAAKRAAADAEPVPVGV